MSDSQLYLSREQVREFDRRAIEELGVPSIVLMENAGRNAAERVAETMMARSISRALVVCGTGNNGGDGFVIGRHLLIRGYAVSFVVVGDAEKRSPDCRIHHDIIRALGCGIDKVSTQIECDRLRVKMSADQLIVDALLGTGFRGEVRSPVRDAIEVINRCPKAAVVAVDVPSGLDADLGIPQPVAVEADFTVTFVALKKGFQFPAASRFTGAITVVDIGIPGPEAAS